MIVLLGIFVLLGVDVAVYSGVERGEMLGLIQFGFTLIVVSLAFRVWRLERQVSSIAYDQSVSGNS